VRSLAVVRAHPDLDSNRHPGRRGGIADLMLRVLGGPAHGASTTSDMLRRPANMLRPFLAARHWDRRSARNTGPWRGHGPRRRTGAGPAPGRRGATPGRNSSFSPRRWHRPRATIRECRAPPLSAPPAARAQTCASLPPRRIAPAGAQKHRLERRVGRSRRQMVWSRSISLAWFFHAAVADVDLGLAVDVWPRSGCGTLSRPRVPSEHSRMVFQIRPSRRRWSCRGDSAQSSPSPRPRTLDVDRETGFLQKVLDRVQNWSGLPDTTSSARIRRA